MDRLLAINEISQLSIDALTRHVEKFQDEWMDRIDLDPNQLLRLKEMATVQSIGSSTRIEGSELDDEEVNSLIENMQITELKSRDEQEVAGYYRVLQIILESYDDIPLSTNIIKGLHKQLLQYSDKDMHHRGNYKTLSNQVVATLPDGNQRTIFKTTPPMQVEGRMDYAVQWFNREIEADNYHELVVIGAFIYEFLTIHPFQDGNGRLSRLLTTLLLLKQGYDFVQYASFEREIERNKADYYKSLMLAQRFRDMEEEIIHSWLVFFLKSLKAMTVRLSKPRQPGNLLEDAPTLYLNPRQSRVVDYFERKGVLSVGDIDRLLPEVSRNTLKYDLARLTKAGYLKRRGKGRGTVYTLRESMLS